MKPITALRTLALAASLASVALFTPAVWARGNADTPQPSNDNDCQELGDFIIANYGKGMKAEDFGKAVHGKCEQLRGQHKADAHKGKGHNQSAGAHKGGPPPWAGKGNDAKVENKGKLAPQGNHGVIFARGNAAQGAGGAHRGGPPLWADKGHQIGKYVQSLVERGLRGRELASAIHSYLRDLEIGKGHGNPGGNGAHGNRQGKGGPPPNHGNQHGNEGGRGGPPPGRGHGR